MTLRNMCGPEIGLPGSPNSVQEGQGFCVSYNDTDVGLYGDDTTALVLGQGEAFFILVGDHRSAYADLLTQGFDACLRYFIAHVGQAHRFSDPAPFGLWCAGVSLCGYAQ